MCWAGKCFNHCYECAKEFNHGEHVIPCYAYENRAECKVKQLEYDIIQTSETCNDCTAARKAEEECQRTIYRSRPLNLAPETATRKRITKMFWAFRERKQQARAAATATATATSTATATATAAKKAIQPVSPLEDLASSSEGKPQV
ncbi:hypothetical protein GGR50DRAFT_690764 [Xylaria sp. CBS 124048]|nr:hypothetical protein GGR50DRAFT_690764 [Xylaria sp. CBS 124048]